jgi:hypothetical protein
MSPGPVSDSYDPEFGTGANAHDVAEAIRDVRVFVTSYIGSDELLPIVALARNDDAKHPLNKPVHVGLTERQLRIIRFCLDRSLESI